MRIAKYKFLPAHSSNYTKGRSRPITKFTVHHTVGYEASLAPLWQNPNRNGSSHFFAHPNYGEQYVSLLDTAWTNGSSTSNAESITCETRGDWRNGYYNQATLNTLTDIMYECLKLYPNLKMEFHMDVVDKRYYPGGTQCPAELKTRGHAQACWNKAQNRLAVEKKAAQPKQPATLRTDLPDKKVILTVDTNLWDMSFKTWSGAKAVAALPAGTVIDVAGLYNHPLGGKYYLSKYSWDKGINNGINVKDTKDYVAPAPKPTPKPAPQPVNEPVTPPEDSTVKGGAGTLPPVPFDPKGDLIVENNNLLKQILGLVQWIVDKLKGVFK